MSDKAVDRLATAIETIVDFGTLVALLVAAAIWAGVKTGAV